VSECGHEHVGLSPAQRTLRAVCTRSRGGRRPAMDVMFDRVAGLDIGKASVTVCVRTPGEKGRRKSQTRTFRTMTRSLVVMADWLDECGVELASMESTATYWKPVFYCLEERMETWLLNAAHMKAVPGRKSDV
jgi:transposase